MAPKSPSNLYPITIIGAGITGLSTAYHLHKLGIGPAKVYHTSSNQALSKEVPAYVTGGCWDNFTRISHVRGGSSAALFWGFGDQAFEELKYFCMQHKLPWSQGPRLRLICSKEELCEASQAIKELNQFGFSQACFWSRDQTKNFGARVLEVQEDSQKAAITDAKKILGLLQKHIVSQGTRCYDSEVLSINEDSKGLQIRLPESKVDHSEMLVFACHHQIGDLLPDLREAIIPVADQWSRFSTDRKVLPPVLQGQAAFISAHHGYEWSLSLGDGSLLGGGCRYLRKHAGIGDHAAVFDPKIELKNSQQFESWFQQPKIRAAGKGQSGSEIYPCDETPLIGPMFGTDRMVIATGFMHLGLSYGFFAGKCLAELIHSGQCESLPRLFWPERLRSL
ncbi:MAG: FAD-binding oxidoreductase [Oligoflexales bacterium]|nr:FAD-binding oxidoreductase [Oligoflexales bacterium]